MIEKLCSIIRWTWLCSGRCRIDKLSVENRRVMRRTSAPAYICICALESRGAAAAAVFSCVVAKPPSSHCGARTLWTNRRLQSMLTSPRFALAFSHAATQTRCDQSSRSTLAQHKCAYADTGTAAKHHLCHHKQKTVQPPATVTPSACDSLPPHSIVAGTHSTLSQACKQACIPSSHSQHYLHSVNIATPPSINTIHMYTGHGCDERTQLHSCAIIRRFIVAISDGLRRRAQLSTHERAIQKRVRSWTVLNCQTEKHAAILFTKIHT